MTGRRRWILAAALAVAVLAGVGVWWFATRPDGSGRGGPGRPGPGPGGSAVVPGDPSTGLGSTAPAPSGSASGSGWWRPVAGLTWQWQLSGGLDRSVDAQVYDVDAVDTSAADVAALHAAGRKVICYVNAGAFEEWRPDAARFPATVLGKPLPGWPGERWIDIRRWEALEPILAARFETCRAKGFDGVEPDNVDGYTNESGFPLSADDQIRFNRRLADLAHRLGLAVGLKNDVEQAAALEPAFDFAINEQCLVYDECAALRAFVAAGKPVFHAEYTTVDCGRARALGFSSVRKRQGLDAWREPC